MQSLQDIDHGQIYLSSGITENEKKNMVVIDNGPGIPQELMDQIFVPFFTTKNTGTGIGLSLSKQIMQLHQRNLKVYSVPYEETSFKLLF